MSNYFKESLEKNEATKYFFSLKPVKCRALILDMFETIDRKAYMKKIGDLKATFFLILI
jgi:hypothetical protein